MPALKITVLVEKDGQVLPGFPYVRRITTDQVSTFEYIRAADNNITAFGAIPAPTITTMTALILRPDAAINVRLNNQATQLIPINPNGLVLLVDCAMAAGLNLDALVNNPAAAAAVTVRGLAMGTTP